MLGNAVVDFLFPPHCAGCGRHGGWLCPACIDAIEEIRPPLCALCGLPLGIPASRAIHHEERMSVRCRGCRQTSSQLDGLRSYAHHSDPLRQAIIQLKYESLRAVAAPLGELMVQGWAVLFPRDCVIDIVVPIPLHARRERERGYNQAALLACALGLHLGVPIEDQVLVRVRDTRPQVGLDVTQRRANLHRAFRCAGSGATGKRVLLVDDVCTSGSTLEEAAAALREGGASKVWSYTLTRASQ